MVCEPMQGGTPQSCACRWAIGGRQLSVLEQEEKPPVQVLHCCSIWDTWPCICVHVPECVLTYIHGLCPSEDGRYTGCHNSREDDDNDESASQMGITLFDLGLVRLWRSACHGKIKNSQLTAWGLFSDSSLNDNWSIIIIESEFTCATMYCKTEAEQLQVSMYFLMKMN